MNILEGDVAAGHTRVTRIARRRCWRASIGVAPRRWLALRRRLRCGAVEERKHVRGGAARLVQIGYRVEHVAKLLL